MNHISSKDFEVLIANLQRRFAGGSDVEQNAKIQGKITGKKREVDVAVRTSVAGEVLLIAVECRRRRRRSDVAEVEAFASKLKDIAAHKGIMVSAKGFSKAAKRLATSENISLYRYEDTLSDGWPSGLETSVIVRIWELFPSGSYIKRSDGSLTNIHTDDEHDYIDNATGKKMPLATLFRKYWEMVPDNEKHNGENCYEYPIASADDPSVIALGLAFRSFRHAALRIGRLQFEGLVDDESHVAKVMGWKMVFPDAETMKLYHDSAASGNALCLRVSSTIVNIGAEDAHAQIKLLLYGHLEFTVGIGKVHEVPFSSPHSRLS